MPVPDGIVEAEEVLDLQRRVGNRAVTRWILARDGPATASAQADDTTTGLRPSQHALVRASLLPYPQAIRAALPPEAPDFARAKSLMGGFDSTLRGAVASHGGVTSLAQGLLAGAAGPMGEINAMLDARLMSARDRSLTIEAKFRNAEAELGNADRYTQAEADAQIERVKGAGGKAADAATEAALRRRYAPLTDDQRAELRARFIGPLAGLVAAVSDPSADYHALRDTVTALVGALRGFVAGASEKVSPDLQSGLQKLAEASRMIDVIVGDRTATVRTIRQLLGEVESTLQRLLALPLRPDPEAPPGAAPPPTRLPAGLEPPAPAEIRPD